MSRPVALVTDSTAGIPPSYLDEYHISVAPLNLIWGNQTYEDGVDIHPVEFYQRLEKSTVMPSSSQVSPAKMIEIFSSLTDQGYDILAILISSRLSGTLNSADQAVKSLPDSNVAVVDSYSTVMALGFQVLQAARAAANGASLRECKSVAERARMQSQVYFVVDTLDYLRRGGRIGGASHFLGTALNLKPILTLKDGEIQPVGKVRTSKKALERILDIIAEDLAHSRLNRICVLHANSPEAGMALLAECERRFQPTEALLAEIGPVIGVHTGPGTIGVAYLKDM